MSDENGRAKTKSILHLELDHATFGLTITGDVASADCALAMLYQAKRTLEVKQAAADAPRLAIGSPGTFLGHLKGPRQ